MQPLKTSVREIQAGHKEAEILLYDDIGYWGVTAKMFADELKSIGSIDAITVGISSDGGDAFDGIAIFNMLAAHPAKITTRVDGIAASAASLVAMGGDRIAMAQNSTLMIHAPWTVAIGDANELHRVGELLDTLTDQYIDTYALRRGIARETVEAKVIDETWMTAQAAVEAGFADEVIETPAIAARIPQGRYKHTPAALLDTKAVYTPPPPKWRVAASQRQRDLTLAKEFVR